MDSQFQSLSNLPTHTQMKYSDPQMLKLKEGREIGKYCLVEKVGEGGMGVVWKALDTVGNRYVALKFVPAEIRHREDAMEQVKTVFSRIQALNHQHICPILALEKDEQLGYFVVMKWLEGQSLDKLARSWILRKSNLIIPILKAVASALDYAHGEKVLHRDVKPSNIFVRLENDRIKEVSLIDFGLASEIHTSLSQFSNRIVNTSGTRPYMPPEQWQGKRQTERTDQYSLGIVAYELFAGYLPFQIPDVAMLRLAIMQDAPEEIEDVPEAVNTAILRALAKKPEGRFSSCGEFVNALEGQVFTTSSVSNNPEPTFGAKQKTVAELEQEYYEKLRAELAQKHAEKLRQKREVEAKKKAEARLIAELEAEEERKREAAEAKRKHEEERLRKQEEAEAKRKAEEKRKIEEQFEELKEKYAPLQVEAGKRMVKTVDGIEYAFRYCPPGVFMMGDKDLQHQVTLTKGFWLLETQVTQEMWKSVMGNNPSWFKFLFFTTRPKHPVENVSWDDCQDFCRKLTQKIGMKISLPTEAQWEYACRAGTTTPFNFGSTLNGDKANCNGNYPYGTSTEGTYHEKTVAVKSYAPNAWGLYDMHGNVWEWCQDWYGDYPTNSVTDPTGPDSGTYRVNRGGSWGNYGQHCQSATRDDDSPSLRIDILGFRVVLMP
ncbi:MAG: SUMF1/EgtB/PvdO family nonheme iron enzyme [Planctomycetia bacterium]|nr:SUMF1/EgtB/PvdO family nonheme iron enzyme [Planctomycetia bacterium]